MSRKIYKHLKQINNTFFIISALILNKIIFTVLGILFLGFHLPIRYIDDLIIYGDIFDFLSSIDTTILTKTCFVVVVISGIVLLSANICKSIHTLMVYKYICKKKGLTHKKIFSTIFFYTTFLSKIYVPFVYFPILLCYVGLEIYNFTMLDNNLFNFWLYLTMSVYALFFIFYELFYIWKSCFIFEKLTISQIKKIELLEKEIGIKNAV